MGISLVYRQFCENVQLFAVLGVSRVSSLFCTISAYCFSAFSHCTCLYTTNSAIVRYMASWSACYYGSSWTYHGDALHVRPVLVHSVRYNRITGHTRRFIKASYIIHCTRLTGTYNKPCLYPVVQSSYTDKRTTYRYNTNVRQLNIYTVSCNLLVMFNALRVLDARLDADTVN